MGEKLGDYGYKVVFWLREKQPIKAFPSWNHAPIFPSISATDLLH